MSDESTRPFDYNPANRVSDAVEAVMSAHQDALYEAHGIFECAHQFLEQDQFDSSAARYAMQAALRQLYGIANRLERIAINIDADKLEDQQAAAAYAAYQAAEGGAA